MKTNSGKTAIEALSANALDTRFENLDAVTVKNAKNRIIDVIGCAIGAANVPSNVALVDLVKDWGGKPEATLLVHGGKVPAHQAAMVNSIIARSYDYEVMNIVVEGVMIAAHHAATMVMTALALGELKGINGKELITAMLVGDDVTARILAASNGRGPGWDGTGTLCHFGATAIAGRLLGLNQIQMKNAFGIVLSLVAGASQSQWDGETTFKLGQGASARSGIFSAHLAKKGWTGVEDALLSTYGYYFLYAQGCKVKPEILTKDLGKKFYAEAFFKAYPCGMPTHAAIDSALAIVQKNDIKAEDIKEVTVCLHRMGIEGPYGQQFRIRDFPQGDAIFSYQYTVANALLRRSVKLEHFSDESIRDPKVNALIAKTKLTELIGVESTRSAEVRVKMKDGREFSEFTALPRANPFTKPASDDEIIAKYRSQVEFSKTVSKKNAEELLKLLNSLEDVDNINKIIGLLAA